MGDVFVWQENGRLSVFAMDTTEQYQSLLLRLVSVLCGCDEHKLADEVSYFLTTDASKQTAACHTMLNRIVNYVDYYPDTTGGFQIFSFQRLIG